MKIERWRVEWRASRATKQFMQDKKRMWEGNHIGGSTDTFYIRTFGDEELAKFFMKMLESAYSVHPKIEKRTIERDD